MELPQSTSSNEIDSIWDDFKAHILRNIEYGEASIVFQIHQGMIANIYTTKKSTDKLKIPKGGSMQITLTHVGEDDGD